MTAVIRQTFEGAPIRFWLDEQGEPWAVGKDICRALSLGNHRDALSRLAKDERRRVRLSQVGQEGVGIADPLANNEAITDGYSFDQTVSNPQRMVVINEPGIFRLVLTSRVPAAERFKRWLCWEVLPQIRRTGQYLPEPSEEETPDWGEEERAASTTPIILPEDAGLWLTVIREARLIGGKQAALVLWQASPLPPLPIEPSQRTPSEAAQAALEQVRPWAESCLVDAPGERAQAMRLYRNYSRWASGQGRKPVTMTAWGRVMAGLGFRRVRGSVVRYLDVDVLDHDEV